MPEAWSGKDERMYEHIKKSSKKRGRSSRRAKQIAAATVNKKRSAEGRTKKAKKKGRKKTSRKRTTRKAGARRGGTRKKTRRSRSAR